MRRAGAENTEVALLEAAHAGRFMADTAAIKLGENGQDLDVWNQQKIPHKLATAARTDSDLILLGPRMRLNTLCLLLDTRHHRVLLQLSSHLLRPGFAGIADMT